jgi:hypothetical protein
MSPNFNIHESLSDFPRIGLSAYFAAVKEAHRRKWERVCAVSFLGTHKLDSRYSACIMNTDPLLWAKHSKKLDG